MYITELTLPVEDFLRPLARKAEAAGEWTKKFNDLGDVVIIFAVFGARLGVEEVVSCY